MRQGLRRQQIQVFIYQQSDSENSFEHEIEVLAPRGYLYLYTVLVFFLHLIDTNEVNAASQFLILLTNIAASVCHALRKQLNYLQVVQGVVTVLLRHTWNEAQIAAVAVPLIVCVNGPRGWWADETLQREALKITIKSDTKAHNKKISIIDIEITVNKRETVIKAKWFSCFWTFDGPRKQRWRKKKKCTLCRRQKQIHV